MPRRRSPPRLAHFSFVQAGTLGQEPHTESKDCRGQATERGLVATNCLFWQPGAVPALKDDDAIVYVHSVRALMVATR